MARRCAGMWITAIACLGLGSTTAYAGPVEQLSAVAINPADPSHIVVPYSYGGGGMFISQDAGESFGWLCSGGIDSSAVNRNGHVFASGDGSIYIGLFDGLLRGDASGCGFTAVAELADRYVSDVTGDPIDPKRTYAVTTDPMEDNGIFMNDGSGTFAPLGMTEQIFINTLHVVKNGDARRFYETGVKTDAMTNEVTYSVRVSDDEGNTWTQETYDLAQFGPMNMYAEFAIVAIDPSNPDHVLARVKRDPEVDSLVFSPDQGKAGTWQLIAEPTELGGVAYTPDGKLYFGDGDQKTKGLYVVDAMGAMPKKLSESWRVLCLGYDGENQRLYGCGNYFLFGTVDPASGELQPELDLRCAEKFVECPGQEEMSAVCQPQALQDFCHVTHWVLAPVCDVYDRGAELAMYQADQTYMCVDGFGVPKSEDAAAGGAAGSGGMSTAMMSGAAGSTMTTTTTMTTMTTTSTTSTAGSAARTTNTGATAGSSAAPPVEGEGDEPTSQGDSGGCHVAGGASGLSGLLSFGGTLGLLIGFARRRRARRER